MDFQKPQGQKEVTERAGNTQPHDVGVDILFLFFLYRTLTQQSVAIVHARKKGRGGEDKRINEPGNEA